MARNGRGKSAKLGKGRARPSLPRVSRPSLRRPADRQSVTRALGATTKALGKAAAEVGKTGYRVGELTAEVRRVRERVSED